MTNKPTFKQQDLINAGWAKIPLPELVQKTLEREQVLELALDLLEDVEHIEEPDQPGVGIQDFPTIDACYWCGHSPPWFPKIFKGKPHAKNCPWLTLMLKAGRR